MSGHLFAIWNNFQKRSSYTQQSEMIKKSAVYDIIL